MTGHPAQTRPLTAGDVLTARQLTAPDGLVPFASAKSVLRWASEGQIPSHKKVGKVYFLRPEIEAWLREGTRGEQQREEAA